MGIIRRATIIIDPPTNEGGGGQTPGDDTEIPQQTVSLIVVKASDYLALQAQVQKLQAYISALSQTYEIRDPQGNLVVLQN